MDDFELEIEEMKKTPTECKEVLGIFGDIGYECSMCGECEGIKPFMNNCPWCGQIFKWQ